MRALLVVLALFVAVLGACAAPSSSCNGCTGCCDNGKCVSGSSTLACGSAGFACTACGPTQACVSGTCQGSAGTGGGGGTVGTASYMVGPDGGMVVSIATGDPCSAFASLLAETETKLAACPGIIAASPHALTEANCRALLPECNAQDRANIDLLLNCLRRAPPCINGGSNSRFDVCSPLAAQLSRACQASFYR